MNIINIIFILLYSVCIFSYGQGENKGYDYILSCYVVNTQMEPLPDAYAVHRDNKGTSTTIKADNKGFLSFPMHTMKDGVLVYSEGYIPYNITGKLEDNSRIILERLTDETILEISLVDSSGKNTDKIGNFYNTILPQYVKEKGSVLLSYTIDKEGNIKDIEIKSGNTVIRDEVTKAVSYFPQLEPFLLYNKPVNVRIENDAIRFPSLK